MAQHFKKIIKSGKPKAKQVALVVSQYLKDINFVDLSPTTILKEATREELVHNFMLARCYYGALNNVRFNKKDSKKPKRPRSQWWISYDWELHKYDKTTQTWEHINSPLYPGTRNIFEDENKPTTENLFNEIQKLEKKEQEDKDSLTLEERVKDLNGIQDLIREAEEDD